MYNATHQTLTLYVNGQQAGQASGVQPSGQPATGRLRLGEDMSGDAFPGYVSDACAFYGVLSDSNTPVAPETSSDIASLYDNGGGDGCAILHSAYP